MQTIKIYTNEPDSNSERHLFNSIPCLGSTSAASESRPQKWPKMHAKQPHHWDWHNCQMSRAKKRVMLGSKHLKFGQFYFTLHLSSALRVCELHHSTFHVFDRSLIVIQRYMYKCQGERTQHLAATYPLTALFYPVILVHRMLPRATHTHRVTCISCSMLETLAKKLLRCPMAWLHYKHKDTQGWLHRLALQTEQGRGQRKGTETG